MKYETLYCPFCSGEKFFTFWNKKKNDTWAFCKECHRKAPLADFDPDYIDHKGQAVDDRVHEYINEHWRER